MEDKETKEVRVLKDYWVEDRRRHMGHEIVVGIKKTISSDDFLNTSLISVDAVERAYPTGSETFAISSPKGPSK